MKLKRYLKEKHSPLVGTYNFTRQNGDETENMKYLLPGILQANWIIIKINRKCV